MVALNGRISGFFSIIPRHVTMNWIVVFTVSTEGKEERNRFWIAYLKRHSVWKEDPPGSGDTSP